ncbi:hypothetical protein BOO71_0002497 [Deinococcus marmoris]|uniref:Uncharacterized protein n=1 Tax=Deinococcus marmoris TaxID=249408 RepID=A0A1U7P352_9DEIO|nr:hypothetical protein BOO71_0002497 [Deinococcus marmoris]
MGCGVWDVGKAQPGLAAPAKAPATHTLQSIARAAGEQ